MSNFIPFVSAAPEAKNGVQAESNGHAHATAARLLGDFIDAFS